MAEHRIVEVSLVDGTLTIAPSTFEIQDGDWLWWRFAGLPEGSSATIRFGVGLGPFQSIRSVPSRQWPQHQYILAKGNVGAQGIYDYTALVVVPGEGEPRGIAHSQIINASTTENLSPKARVLYHPAAPGQLGTLILSPRPLQLFDGDTAIWESENLPVGSFLDLQFTGSARSTSPFVALYTVLHSGARQIHDTGFAVGTADTFFEYTMELRDAKGILLAKTDPQIDRLPPPPDPPAGS
jgi:hypothetical protein